jgi:acyl-CoA reductase-like NAD-dependent aldehyde dehydrogenase
VKTQELFIVGPGTSTLDHLEVTKPWDGSVKGQAAKCEREHVTVAVNVAAVGVHTLRPAHKRTAVLPGVAILVAKRAEEFVQSIHPMAGKPITAVRAELGRAIGTVHFSAEAARRVTGV